MHAILLIRNVNHKIILDIIYYHKWNININSKLILILFIIDNINKYKPKKKINRNFYIYIIYFLYNKKFIYIF